MASESAIGSVIGNSAFSCSSVTELVAIHVHCTTVPKLCTSPLVCMCIAVL